MTNTFSPLHPHPSTAHSPLGGTPKRLPPHPPRLAASSLDPVTGLRGPTVTSACPS